MSLSGQCHTTVIPRQIYNGNFMILLDSNIGTAIALTNATSIGGWIASEAPPSTLWCF